MALYRLASLFPSVSVQLVNQPSPSDSHTIPLYRSIPLTSALSVLSLSSIRFSYSLPRSTILFPSSTLPPLHSSSLPPLHSSTLPLFHSSILPLLHSSSLPLLHSSTLPLFQSPFPHSSTLPPLHSSSLPLFPSLILHISTYTLLHTYTMPRPMLWTCQRSLGNSSNVSFSGATNATRLWTSNHRHSRSYRHRWTGDRKGRRGRRGG